MKSILLSLLCIFTSFVQAQERLDLNEAIDIALENSPDVRRSRLNLDQNRESLNAEYSRLKSNFSLSLTPIDFNRSRQFDDYFSQWYTTESYAYYGALTVRQPIVATDGTLTLTNRLQWRDQSVENFQGENQNKAYSNNLFLSYNQPLFTYNRTKMALRELELALENAALSFSIQRLSIERTVTQSYYDVFREQESLQISRDEYDNQLKNYEITKNKAESGLVAREELFQAEVNLANSQSSFKNQEVNLENVKDDFKRLLGINLYDALEIETSINVSPVNLDMSVAIENGLKSRQEIRQREIDMEYAKNDMIRTQSTNEFRGDLALSVGIFGDDEVFPQVYSTPTNSPSVSLTFAVPIWDWGEKKARIKATEASIATQQLNMTDQENDIILSIRRSYRSLQNLENQITIAEQSVRNAQLTYDINQERYANGDITGIDLNQYQNQLSQARIDLLSAKINYRLELLNMKIQSLWDFETNTSILPSEISKKDK